MDPGSVNNSARSVMAAVKKLAEDTGGGLAAGGTGNAITLTTNQVLSSAHVAAGLTLTFRATATNTGATTINVDSTGAVSCVDQFGAALAAGAITSGGIYTVAYNANTSKWVLMTPAVVPTAAYPAFGLVLLTSGTLSSASTLDLVLTSYTAYRGFKLMLSGFLPATDNTHLWMRFSSDGGSSFDASSSNYEYAVYGGIVGTATILSNSTADGSTNIGLSGSSASTTGIGNASTEGWNGTVELLNLTSSSLYSRLSVSGSYISAAGASVWCFGGGARKAAQDTDAIRVLFSSGNIASGKYALYGYV